MGLEWYKRNPHKALEGMFELDLAERGAYNTVIDLIYARNNNLPDDDHFIAGWCRVDVRVWRRIKAKLLELKKLSVCDGKLTNSYADVVILRATSTTTSRKVSGAEGGRKSGDVRRENSNLDEGKSKETSNRTKNRELRTKKEPPIPPGSGFGFDEPEEPEKPHIPDMDEVVLAQDFENFWSQWRPFDIDKGSKSAAKKSYLKIRKETDHETIIRGATAYADYCHATQQRTRHAVTWLNQRGWEDEYPDPQSPGKTFKKSATSGNIPIDAARIVLDKINREREIRSQTDRGDMA